MNTNKHNPVDLIDQAAEQIRQAKPLAEQTAQAADRVWQRLSGDGAAAAADAAEVERLDGHEDYEALIPAYLAGSLSDARKMLFDDYLRESMPLRRALKQARAGLPPQQQPTVRPSAAGFSSRWAMAALLVVGVGMAAVLGWQLLPFGSAVQAVVVSADGDLFRVGDTSHLPLERGDSIRRGDAVRAGRAGGAVVKLNDGSLVELRARTEMSIRSNRRGTTLDLERGSVIVQAAKQRDKHLYVATEDCLVSVTGTIFSVNHGTKGSRVSVIEGEVRVDYSGQESVLLAGDQVATHTSLLALPVNQEIAWSKDVDHYLSVLGELSSLRRELRQGLAPSSLRYSSRLLDLVPPETAFYAAVPNLGEALGEARQIIDQRISESEILSQWWRQTSQSNGEFQQLAGDILDRLQRLGDYLGDELVVSGQLLGSDDFRGPLVLAEISDAEGLRGFLEQQLDDWSAEWQETGEQVLFVEDPFATAGEGLRLWFEGDLLVATPNASLLAEVAGFVLHGRSNGFVDSSFYNSIAELYDEGADLLLAVDVERVIHQTTDEADASGLAIAENLGIGQLKHLLVEQKRDAERVQHLASLTFDGTRQGLAAWIAAPAPMGALEFISPDAKLFTAVVFEDPSALVDDLQELLPENGLNELFSELSGRFGIDLREDFIATLGGEVAFAIDGPLLPLPAWKVVLEIYDPARFQFAIEAALTEANTQLTAAGEPPLVMEHSQLGGRTVHTIPFRGYEVSYAFVEGYLVVTPGVALLDRAIRYQQSGYVITDSPRFAALLPADGQDNFSALIYHDIVSLVEPFAETLASGQLSDEQRALIDRLKAENRPSLAYVYARSDRLTFAAGSDGDWVGMGILAVLGFDNPLGLGKLLEQATGGAI